MRRLGSFPGEALNAFIRGSVAPLAIAVAAGLSGPSLGLANDAERPAQIPLPEIPAFHIPATALSPAATPEPPPAEAAAAPREENLVVRGVEIPAFAMPSALVPAAETPAPDVKIAIETPPIPALNLSMLQVTPPNVEPAPVEPPRSDAPKSETPKTDSPSAGPALAMDQERLKSILEPHRVRLKLRPVLVEQIASFYADRNWQPVWLDAGGALVPKARGLVDLASRAMEDGLDSARLLATMPVSPGQTFPRDPLAEDRRAEADLLFTLTAIAYAQDARGGRIEPSRLSSMLTPALTLPSAQDVMSRITDAPDGAAVSSALQAFNPPHAGYRALRSALARLRAEAKSEPDSTASIGAKLAELRAALPKEFMAGAGLNPGQSDPRVPHMRLRLGLPAMEGTVYDPALAEAVREFQRANALKPDGRVTPRTRALLEDLESPVTRAQKPRETTDDRIATIIANMERWRWLPPELGRTHIFVNIPEFRLAMMDEGARVFETRIIVGKPERQTPVFSDKMEFLVVNPSWFIPPTILRKDVLPKLAADPGYASRMGYEVIRRGNSISVRQPPGERNALGHVKFMFPNSHSVYLHDTPGRHLFRNEVRAFSSGCVRVEGPFQLAEHLLLKSQGLTERQLRGMVGSGERTIRLAERVPVHLAYFTVQVDANGEIVRQRDIYGHDARIRRALSL